MVVPPIAVEPMIAIVPIVAPAIAPIVIDVRPIVVTIVDPVIPIVDLPRMMIGPTIAARSVRTISIIGTIWAIAIIRPSRPVTASSRPIVAARPIVTAAWTVRSITAGQIAAARTGWQCAGPVAAADPFAAGRTIAEKIGGRAAG
jgi:hypothetical protein